MLKKICFALATTLSLSSAIPALAQAPIQNLPNGNYRFCSNPPRSPVVSDKEFLAAGHCFLFRKTGNRIIGVFSDMSTYGEVGVCARGTVRGNSITGEAIEVFPSEDLPMPAKPEFQGATLMNWNNKGYLKVAKAIYNEKGGYVSSIHYRAATLNLGSFYRYNAGTQSPPTSCQN
jgi:hypothetical protein